MKFLTEIIRHCVSNMEASQAADAVVKQPGANGLIQNGFVRDGKNTKGHREDDKILKAKMFKKKLLTHRRRRRRRSTLSDSEAGSSSEDDQGGMDSDLSEGELDGLLNETYSDVDESEPSSLSEDEDVEERTKSLVNGGNCRGAVFLLK